MSRSDHVNRVLGEVARDLGVQDVALGEDDCATLAFDEMEVDFIYRTEPVELLWLYADLGEIPAGGDAAPALLLQVGFGSWALCRMTIGLDEERRRARGFTAIPVSLLDPAMLDRTLAALLEVALPLRARLAGQDFQLPPPADDGPDGLSKSGRADRVPVEPGLRA
jgi:hypothetical protein